MNGVRALTAWELTRKLLTELNEFDNLMDKKQKAKTTKQDKILDMKINTQEEIIFDIKNKLKNIKL